MTLWWETLHETLHSVKYPATAKIVARQVARKVEPNSTFSNGSCNLPRNDFGRCRVCYTVKCFLPLKLVPPQCRQNIARQVARNISKLVTAPLVIHSSRLPNGKLNHCKRPNIQKLDGSKPFMVKWKETLLFFMASNRSKQGRYFA